MTYMLQVSTVHLFITVLWIECICRLIMYLTDSFIHLTGVIFTLTLSCVKITQILPYAPLKLFFSIFSP